MQKNKNSLFKERVQKTVRSIQKGKTLSYGEVAKRAGNPGAARAVGTIMANNFDKSIPCHRVIRAGGKIGRYNRGGAKQKTALLEKEGVEIKAGSVIKQNNDF
ncbi:MAG: MGMT family protein [Patescibacteria group bacterium]